MLVTEGILCNVVYRFYGDVCVCVQLLSAAMASICWFVEYDPCSHVIHDSQL